MALEHEDLTKRVIGAAIEVHRELGPGFLESVYEEALALELELWRVSFRRQVEITVVYRGVQVGLHRLDLLVDDRVVVELKAIKRFEDIHFAIVRSYLRAFRLKHGPLMNFNRPTLEIKRVLHDASASSLQFG